MNCANHPDIAVSAYCQNCGKPLCASCVRSVSGVIYCEQCLAAKLGIGGAAAPAGYTVAGAPAGGFPYTVNPAGQTVTGSTAGDMKFAAAGIVPPTGIPNPSTATILGFIPGVGAMYNGQYVKALVHVLVFVILIGITDNHPIFGIFIAAWIAYQVFDAHQTAKARRDGLPLPDPFGLNELGSKIGLGNATVQTPFTQSYPATPYVGGTVPGNPVPGNAIPGSGIPAAPYPGATSTGIPYTAGYTGAPYAGIPPAGAAAGFGESYPPYTPYTSVPPAAGPYSADPNAPDPNAPAGRRKEPIGAVVLIGLGMLFLFNTLGVFRFNWIGHFWPLFVIALGAWLLIRRMGGNVGFTAKINGAKQDGPPPPTAPPAGGGQ